MMLLYLMQHGEAMSKEADPDRPLTERGKRQVEGVLLLLMRYGGMTVGTVVHSGKRRAEETAAMIAAKFEGELEEDGDLLPDADPGIWAERVGSRNTDVVLVGHLPHLQRLTGLLLAGDADAPVVRFETGGVVCLEREGDAWSLRWAVTPSLVSE